MMSSTSFAAPTGPFLYEARAGAPTTGIGPNPGSGPGSGFGMHPHHQQPLPMDNTITEPIILDSTFPSTTQPPPHNFTSFNTTNQQIPSNSDEIALQLQNLQSLLTQALSERDTVRLSLATLQNELYNARQVEKRLRIERDEARAQVSFLKKERPQVKQTETRLRRERDEARLALAQAVRGGKVSLKEVGRVGKGMTIGDGKGKAQGGMTGIELLLGSASGARKGVANAGGKSLGQSQMPGVGVGVTAQLGGLEGQSPPGASTQAGGAAVAGLEGSSGTGAITDFGAGMPLQQEYGADIGQQLGEFLMMHGGGSREASPVQQVPTPPGAGIGYGYKASHRIGGQFETIQS